TPEVLVDDSYTEQVTIRGEWEREQPSGTYGLSVLRSEGGDGGSVRFTPEIRTAGLYTVYLYWPAVDVRATNAQVARRHAGGSEERTSGLRSESEGVQHGMVSWVSRSEYSFDPAQEAWLEIGTQGDDGAVLADEVLFVPVR